MGLLPGARAGEGSAAESFSPTAAKGGQYRYPHFTDDESKKLGRAHLESVAILGPNPLRFSQFLSFLPYFVVPPPAHNEASNCTIQTLQYSNKKQPY